MTEQSYRSSSDRGARPVQDDARGSSPRLAAVVASRADRAHLVEFLRSMVPSCRAWDIDVVVVRPEDYGDLEQVRRRHPEVDVVSAPSGADSSELRSQGLLATDADIVALFEDLQAFEPERLRALVDARRERN